MDVTAVTDNGWTLHYTIGHELAAPVKVGDLIHLPGERGDLTVLGGRAPLRVNERGGVVVRDPVASTLEQREVHPRALGMVWISASGGWSELGDLAPRYDPDAVQQQIDRDRRRHRITRTEERLIHALLKGRGA